MKRLIIVFILCAILAGLAVYSHAYSASPLRDFNDEAELYTWVEAHPMATVLYFDAAGTINFNNIKPDPRYDCDDYARDMRDWAAEEGYYLGIAPVSRNGLIFGKFHVRPPDYNYHVGLMAIAGNYFYYVEPQTGEIFKLLPVD